MLGIGRKLLRGLLECARVRASDAERAEKYDIKEK
jgi:hypothetical protein